MNISLAEGQEDPRKIAFAFSNNPLWSLKKDEPLKPDVYCKTTKIICARIQANKFTLYRESDKDRNYPEEAVKPKDFNELTSHILDTIKTYTKLYKRKFGKNYNLTETEKEEKRKQRKYKLIGWDKPYYMRKDFSNVVGSNIYSRTLYIKYTSLFDLKLLYELFSNYKASKKDVLKLTDDKEKTNKLIKGVNLLEFENIRMERFHIQKLFKYYIDNTKQPSVNDVREDIIKIEKNYNELLEKKAKNKGIQKEIDILKNNLKLLRENNDYDKEEEKEYIYDIERLMKNIV